MIAVVSLNDTPTPQPPVTWRVGLVERPKNVTRDRALFIPGMGGAVREMLQAKVEGGLHFLTEDADFHMQYGPVYETMTHSRVVANPDQLEWSGHECHSIALVAGLLYSAGAATPGEQFVFCGSFAGDGQALPLSNPISVAMQAKSLGKTLVTEWGSAEIAKSVYPNVLGIIDGYSLNKVISHDPEWCAEPEPRELSRVRLNPSIDLQNVIGQARAKTALQVAVAGGHDLLLIGAPGQGKSLLAKCIPGIAPHLSLDEAVSVGQIYHAAGKLPPTELPEDRPLRSVDATVTRQALLGGGADMPFPGEVSLAHCGYLYFDELLQCTRSTLESLRTPMQDGEVTISRVAWKSTFPADFALIAASNPCPCGYWSPDHPEDCTCPPANRKRYRSRLSGPMLDRIEVRCFVDNVTPESYLDSMLQESESSAEVAVRVAGAVQKQLNRQGCLNAQIPPKDEHQLVRVVDKEAAKYYAKGKSTRGLVSLLKLARTVADLSGEDLISAAALAQAAELSPDIPVD